MKLIIPTALVLILGSCATFQQARTEFLNSTDVSVSAGYDGVTVSDTITDGRRHIQRRRRWRGRCER
jgi:uncharacterized lipoprotein YajG